MADNSKKVRFKHAKKWWAHTSGSTKFLVFTSLFNAVFWTATENWVAGFFLLCMAVVSVGHGFLECAYYHQTQIVKIQDEFIDKHFPELRSKKLRLVKK